MDQALASIVLEVVGTFLSAMTPQAAEKRALAVKVSTFFEAAGL